MKRILLLCAALLLTITSHLQVWAQDRTVTGKVTAAEDGSALPGVNVVVKGTTNGTTTTAEGTYSISAPANATLVFSFIGLVTQEVPVNNRSTLNVQMASDVKQLSEVVVIGYGTQERKNLTGSVTSISGETIANLATPSFDQQLAGRAPGVQVTVPSGVLGQAPQIRIRGTNSISSGASPLIVVDGVPVIASDPNSSFAGTASNNALADINPSDIESYEVLKDGSATAIYGSRAANGVILITTKKGKQGRARVNYDNYIGWSTPTKRFDVLNAEQFIEISNEKLANAGEDAGAFPIQNPDGSIVDTDWQDVIFRTGFQHNHALSISGATEKTNYFFSLGYTDQKGFIVSNQIKRATFRANIDHKVLSWLSVGANMGLTRTQNVGLNVGTNSLSGNVTSATALLPNVPVRNADGTFNLAEDANRLGPGNNLLPVAFNYPNIGFVLANNQNNVLNYRILGNTFLEARLAEGLRLRTQYGVDAFLNEYYTFWHPEHGDGFSSNGYVNHGYSPTFRWNWQNTLNYDKTIGENHRIGLVVGTEYQKTNTSYTASQATDLADPFFGKNNIISGTFSTPDVDGGTSQNGFDSYFGRINYAFGGKYLASFTIRNDGLSSLPKSTRRGTFMGGSLGWRVSEESFFENAEVLSFISDLKLRTSYAQVGNVDIGNFPYVGTYASAQYASQNGISFFNVGNPNLRWESSNKFDAGLDLGLFSDRIAITFDYYRNNVDDLILFAPTAFSLGVPGNGVNKNIGSLVNTGIELGISTRNIDNGSFTWTTEFNFSTNRNEITALNNNEDIVNTYNITRVGESIGSIYGFEYAGVNAANGNPLYKKGNGQIIQGNIANNTYYEYNPENPEVVTTGPVESRTATATLSATEDRKVLGVSNPRWFGGLSNTFTYKGFDLNIFARYSGGNKIMNVTRQNQLRMGFQNNSTEILRRWTTPGQVTDVPKLEAENSNFINNEGFAVSRFVENGDFIRIQNISLGYTVPKTFLNRFSITNLRIFAQVQNAFTFTAYKGLDPEINANVDAGTLASRNRANNQFGIDFNGNPPQRVYTIGLNLGI